MTIVTSITALPTNDNDNMLEITARTDFGNGNFDEFNTTLPRTLYDEIRFISKRLAEDTLKLTNNQNPDGANLSTGMQLALMRAHVAGKAIEELSVSSSGYSAAKVVAFENQLLPHYELVGKLFSALTALKPVTMPDTWSERTTQSQSTPVSLIPAPLR